MTYPNAGNGRPKSVSARGVTEPFDLQVSRQDIAYHWQFDLCGYTSNIGTTTGALWEGQTGTSGLYVYPSSAVLMTFVSTSASDTSTVTINGTDANFNMLSETVKLNGVTGVNTVNAYFRVNSIMYVGGTNVGVITAKNGGITYAQINVGIGQSQMSVFTVPANFTLFINTVQAQTNIHYTTTIDYILLEYNKQNIASQIPINGYLTTYQAGSSTTLGQSPTNALFQTFYLPPTLRPAGTDIQWLMVASSGTTNPGSVLVSGYLIANTVS